MIAIGVVDARGNGLNDGMLNDGTQAAIKLEGWERLIDRSP
jgi:hypothetical protein